MALAISDVSDIQTLHPQQIFRSIISLANSISKLKPENGNW